MGSEAVFPKLTAVVDGHQKIKDNPPVIFHSQQLSREFQKQQGPFWEQYKKSLQGDRRKLLDRYQWQDGAIKDVGVGSVGTRCYVALFLASDDDPLSLQVKEAGRSVLESPKGQEPLCSSRPSRSRRTAPDASRQRHFSRLGE